jgi:hypothetical protein
MPRCVLCSLVHSFALLALTHSLIHFCVCVDICDVQTDCSRMMPVALWTSRHVRFALFERDYDLFLRWCHTWRNPSAGEIPRPTKRIVKYAFLSLESETVFPRNLLRSIAKTATGKIHKLTLARYKRSNHTDAIMQSIKNVSDCPRALLFHLWLNL